MCWLGLARCARKGPTGCGFKRCLTWRAALQGAPACRTTCQPSRALDQSRSCTAPSAPDGRMSPSRTSADSSTSSHFITAPQVKPAGCAGAAGEQEARDERASVRARGALRAGEQRTASDGESARAAQTRTPTRTRSTPTLTSTRRKTLGLGGRLGRRRTDSDVNSEINTRTRRLTGRLGPPPADFRAESDLDSGLRAQSPRLPGSSPHADSAPPTPSSGPTRLQSRCTRHPRRPTRIAQLGGLTGVSTDNLQSRPS